MLHTPVTSNLFHEIPGNPVPDRATAGFLTARDGMRLRYARFGATGAPAQGHGHHPARPQRMHREIFRDDPRSSAPAASARRSSTGAARAIPDRMLRDPARGYVDNFYDYVRDLEQFFEEIVLPDCRGPFYMLGHSTGSLVALLAAPSMINRVRRMVLCVPLLSLTGFPVSMRTIRRLAGALYAVGLGSMYMAGGAAAARDQAVLDQRADHRPHALPAQLAALRDLSAAGARRPDRRLGARRLHGRRDGAGPGFHRADADPDAVRRAPAPTSVVSTPAIEHYVRQIKSASLLTIDGARHEIWQEADIYREQLLAAFDAFIPGSDAASRE